MLFIESEDKEVFTADLNNLFASYEEQTDNHTLMLDMLYSTMSVCVPTIVEVSFMKNIF